MSPSCSSFEITGSRLLIASMPPPFHRGDSARATADADRGILAGLHALFAEQRGGEVESSGAVTPIFSALEILERLDLVGLHLS